MPFGWSIPDGYSGLALVPEAGETTLHLTISSDAQASYVVTSPPPRSGSGPTPAIGYDCRTYLEIETEMSLRTDNRRVRGNAASRPAGGGIG